MSVAIRDRLSSADEIREGQRMLVGDRRSNVNHIGVDVHL